LTEEEVRQLREGDGMGLARPAELNHYPGPKHVLELAEGLDLSPEQRENLEAIRERMLQQAIAKGEEVLEVERHLAQAFAGANADETTVRRTTAHLGTLRGELQAIHLNAHIETRAALTASQIQRYDELRGYSNSP
jgi:Spy/CpxP family protein refolding chaperone